MSIRLAVEQKKLRENIEALEIKVASLEKELAEAKLQKQAEPEPELEAESEPKPKRRGRPPANAV